MDKNIESFRKMEKALIRRHHGKTAIFSEGRLIVIEKDLKKALKRARQKSKSKEIFIAELYTPEEQTAAILLVA